MVRTWPARVEARRAAALSLLAEETFDAIVRLYLDRGNEPAAAGDGAGQA
jgi:hypothetical protein